MSVSTKVPVTVLSWFLGAWKTTLLNHILSQKWDTKVGVILNDMSEINIDHMLVDQTGSISRTDETLVEMSNGCICCTLREDLLKEVEKLCKQWTYDAIIIESTWISEPIPVAQTFSYIDEETWIDLGQWARLDTMVTVVDATRFMDDFKSEEELNDRQLWLGEEDERTITHLLTDQVEFCDILIVNKRDDIDSAQQKKLLALLKALQSSARVITTNQGKVPINDIVNTWLFDFEIASAWAWWMKELTEEHIPETEEYGISSFVYTPQRPFHPQRLWSMLHQERPWVVRGKGFCWLASRPDAALNWQLAWPHVSLSYWWRRLCTYLDQEVAMMDLEVQEEYVRLRSLEHWGRITQMVVIGIGHSKEVIKNMLDSCLVTDEEWTQKRDTFDDPFEQIMSLR